MADISPGMAQGPGPPRRKTGAHTCPHGEQGEKQAVAFDETRQAACLRRRETGAEKKLKRILGKCRPRAAVGTGAASGSVPPELDHATVVTRHISR